MTVGVDLTVGDGGVGLAGRRGAHALSARHTIIPIAPHSQAIHRRRLLGLTILNQRQIGLWREMMNDVLTADIIGECRQRGLKIRTAPIA